MRTPKYWSAILSVINDKNMIYRTTYFKNHTSRGIRKSKTFKDFPMKTIVFIHEDVNK